MNSRKTNWKLIENIDAKKSKAYKKPVTLIKSHEKFKVKIIYVEKRTT